MPEKIEQNNFELEADKAWSELVAVCPNNNHLEGMSKDYLGQKEIAIINEFLEYMKTTDLDVLKTTAEQLWVHLMQYDEELNRKVCLDSNIQKEVEKYLTKKLDECQNPLAKSIIAANNLSAYIRTEATKHGLEAKKVA